MKRTLLIIISFLMISSVINPLEAQSTKSYKKTREQLEAESQRKKQLEEAKYQQDKQRKEAAYQRDRQKAAEELRKAKEHAKKLKEEEEARYNSADESRDLDLYNRFLSDYPKSSHAAEIRSQAAEVTLWREAAAKGTISGFENYISSSKLHWYDDYAKNAIVELKKKAEKAEWQKVAQINTIDAYQQYINQYPSSGYKAEAENAIRGLQAKAEWEALRNSYNIEGLEAYISKYPDADEVKDAKEQLHILKAEKYFDEGNINAAYNEYSHVSPSSLSYSNKKTFEAVKEAYRFARLSDSSPETQLFSFKNDYPNSKYSTQVNNMIARSKASNLDAFSSVSDYNEALSYAGDEDTRFFVNRHIARSKEMYKEYRKEEKRRIRKLNGGYFNVGFEFLDANVGVSSFDRLTYCYNVGLMLRVGNFNDWVQFAIGVKPGVIYHHIDDEYDYDYENDYNYEKYSYYDDSDSDSSFNAGFHLPVVAQLKLNLFKSSSNSRCFVFGQYQYNVLRPEYIEGQMAWSAGFGFAWPHFDLSFKYSQDINSGSDFCNRIKHSGGISMIYYWHL